MSYFNTLFKACNGQGYNPEWDAFQATMANALVCAGYTLPLIVGGVIILCVLGFIFLPRGIPTGSTGPK